MTPTPLGTNFTAPVGHSGIWSFGVNSVSGKSLGQPGVAWRDFWEVLPWRGKVGRWGRGSAVCDQLARSTTGVSGGRAHLGESAVVVLS